MPNDGQDYVDSCFLVMFASEIKMKMQGRLNCVYYPVAANPDSQISVQCMRRWENLGGGLKCVKVDNSSTISSKGTECC